MQSPENLAALMAPRDENALLMQRMEDSSLRQLWRLTNMLFRVRNGALTLRDVKNEDRTPGMCMKTQATMTKCPAKNTAFYRKMHQLRDNRQKSGGLFGRKCTDYAINRGEVADLAAVQELVPQVMWEDAGG